ncbi:MAG TPA: hypothetical protein PK014_02360 [Thermoanaerobaculia bacterium]|nr:hypothetical protein [Thermoanaerobaculia bacterium]HUM28924.1 hypothetical protein [Thermoanaerobaculia bacterium]HXK67143.1 hypothetical protein [Thermoanaerobaculia bacterium]
MIQGLLLLVLLQPASSIQEGFQSLNPDIWSTFISREHTVLVSLPPADISDLDLGRDQLLVLIRELSRSGKTETFTIEEYNLGNPPKGMGLYLAEWTYTSISGVTTRQSCLIVVEQSESAWSLSEISCKSIL